MEAEQKQSYLERLAGMVEPVTDAAEMLGVSRQRVLQLVKTGKLESVRLGRGNRSTIVISSLSLQEFMDARRGPKADAAPQRAA